MGEVVPIRKHVSSKQYKVGRNSLLAKIHVARKQMALDEDTYRALLKRVTKKDSAAQLSFYQLEAVLREFERLGFSASSKRAGNRKLADDEQAKKIRALWLNLYHLGELRDSSEDALVAYVERMSGVKALQWLTSKGADMVIRGLRGWLDRIGWKQPSQDIMNAVYYKRESLKLDTQVDYSIIAIKGSLIRAQYEIIGQPLGPFVPELMESGQMDGLIEALGVKCRAIKQRDA